MRRLNRVLNLLGICLLLLELGNATSVDGPSVQLTRQAVQLGIEPSVLSELWRNKQPVVISKPDSSGRLLTTTYELSPDGEKIIATTDNEKQPTVAADKAEVTTTTASPVNPQTDWEYLPNSIGNRRTFSTTPVFNNFPSFESSFPQFSTHNWPNFNFPAGVQPQTTTNTENDDQGRTVTTTIKTYRTPVVTRTWSSGPHLTNNWPTFEFPAGVTPQVSTKTELDDQGRTVTTTTKTYKGTLPFNWTPGSGTGALPESWQNRPNFTPNPIPNWIDSGRSGGAASNPFLPQPVPTPVPLPTRPTETSNRPTFRSPGTLDLSPIGGSTRPKATPDFNDDDLFGSFDEVPFTNTRVTSINRSFNSNVPSSTAAVDTNLVDLLSRGGITDKEFRDTMAQGGDVVRKHTTPDGHVITTTLRVNKEAPTIIYSSPQSPPPKFTPPQVFPSQFPSIPSNTPPSTSILIKPPLPTPRTPTLEPEPEPIRPYQTEPLARPNLVNSRPEGEFQVPQKDKVIDDFLSQVNLTSDEILAQNGEVVKTIIDKDGRVLSARFVLSSIKGDDQPPGQSQQKETRK